MSTSNSLPHHQILEPTIVVMVVVYRPRQSGGIYQISRRPPHTPMTVHLTKQGHPRQQPCHRNSLTNFQVGLWMTCPKQL
jgi:hypothetical protein